MPKDFGSRSRRHEKWLMAPHYPGGKTFDFGDRDTNHKTVLESKNLVELKKISGDDYAVASEKYKKAWDLYFSGAGEKPSV